MRANSLSIFTFVADNYQLRRLVSKNVFDRVVMLDPLRCFGVHPLDYSHHAGVVCSQMAAKDRFMMGYPVA